MLLSELEILRRLGQGESIAAVSSAAGFLHNEFQAWWRAACAARVPSMHGTRHVGVQRGVQIDRNQLGIPSIYADNDEDLFFGFGYAMAQDRLFQLDYLRRRGAGHLAEILGADGRELDLLARVVGIQNIFEMDVLARTVGIRRIAERQWEALSGETRTLLTAFSSGINAFIDEVTETEAGEKLPIEFSLLDYRPHAWSPIDCLTIEVEFQWYLTGRFPIIVIPELAKRTLGDGPLYRAFLQCEADDECILPPDCYQRRREALQPIGASLSEPQSAQGSNNWVVSGSRTASGKPLLGSDPHVYFDAVSWWWEVHLGGGSFNVAGMAYVGMPAVMFGRNEHVAWGCTNNICSQRDLYQEKTDPAHPGCFHFDGQWEPARELEEVIHVKGGESVRKTVRFSRNGPIVDEVLPPAARQTGPVSLRWLGAHHGGWLTAMLAMDRAASAAELREAMRPWHVPTFCVVYADDQGHIGYQATGRVPMRNVWERGYRPGWDPVHQWQGLIPFEGMPHSADPQRGWLASANNRPAPEDFAYPLSGTWNDGLRARRIRQMIEAAPKLTRNDFGDMHCDSLSLRAQGCLPHMLKILEGGDARSQSAVRHLAGWNCHTEPDRVGATIFAVFFGRWNKALVAERFSGDALALMGGSGNGLAVALLAGDNLGWFAAGRREEVARQVFQESLKFLEDQLGPDMAQWTWGRLHTMPLRHALSGRGDLGALLDSGGGPVCGDATTVCNTGMGGKLEARSGGNYRMIADFGEAAPRLWAIDASSQSGHAGSANYRDQFGPWLAGEYHALPLDKKGAQETAVTTLRLQR